MLHVPHQKTSDGQNWCTCTYVSVMPLSHQFRGFFKGMAFPVLTNGLINSVVFGSYSNALDFLTQSQRKDRSEGKAASAAHVFSAGCFSGLVQVRKPDTQKLHLKHCTEDNYMADPSTWSSFRCFVVRPLTWWRSVCRGRRELTDTGDPFIVSLSSWGRRDSEVCSGEDWPLPWGTYPVMDSTFCLMKSFERLWQRGINRQASQSVSVM